MADKLETETELVIRDEDGNIVDPDKIVWAEAVICGLAES